LRVVVLSHTWTHIPEAPAGTSAAYRAAYCLEGHA
jgi:hypothetical protein